MKEKLLQIEKEAFNYYQDFTSFKPDNTYGLTLDHSLSKAYTIAGVGFFLASLIIGDKRGYLKEGEALDITTKSLYNFKNIDNYEGMFAHFLDKDTGLRYNKCEYSTIDTWIAFMGMLAVDNYFKNAEVSKLVKFFIKRFNFPLITFNKNTKTYFYMSYNPNKDGAYVEDKPGFIYSWHMLSEALFAYIMYAGVAKEEGKVLALYESFERKKVTYEQYSFYHTPGNTLFVYQLPSAFIDFKNYIDASGINWYENAANAIAANHLSSITNHQDETLKEFGWGATASESPFGYRVYGPEPAATPLNYPDGTYSPSAIVSSIYFCEDLARETLRVFDRYPIKGKYGYYDAFNLKESWFSQRYYAFNKGMELLFSNLSLDKTIQSLITNHPIIQRGLSKLGFRRKK